MLKRGNFRGEKILYPDGVGYCIWIPFDQEDDSLGLAFDFPGEDIKDLIHLLNDLSSIKAELYEEENVSA